MGGKGAAGDGLGGEGVLRTYGTQFFAAVAEEEAIQLEQQRVCDWREKGSHQCAFRGTLHAGQAQETWF